MAVVVDVTFDKRADNTIRRLWRSLAGHGFDVSRQTADRPHLTMFVASDGDPTAIGNRLAEVEWVDIPRVEFGSVGYFRDPGRVLYLAATPTAEILDLHAQIWRIVTSLAPTQSPYYQPRMWTPHCTLALGVPTSDLGKAVEALDGLPTLIEAQILQIRAHAWEDDSSWVSPMINAGTV